jgi:hypothetical protein
MQTMFSACEGEVQVTTRVCHVLVQMQSSRSIKSPTTTLVSNVYVCSVLGAEKKTKINSFSRPKNHTKKKDQTPFEKLSCHN